MRVTRGRLWKHKRKKNRNLKPTSCIRRPLNKKGHCFSADLQVLPSCWYCFCLQVGFPQVCTLATSNSWATHFLERGQHPTHQCKELHFSPLRAQDNHKGTLAWAWAGRRGYLHWLIPIGAHLQSWSWGQSFPNCKAETACGAHPTALYVSSLTLSIPFMGCMQVQINSHSHFFFWLILFMLILIEEKKF